MSDCDFDSDTETFSFVESSFAPPPFEQPNMKTTDNIINKTDNIFLNLLFINLHSRYAVSFERKSKKVDIVFIILTID